MGKSPLRRDGGRGRGWYEGGKEIGEGKGGMEGERYYTDLYLKFVINLLCMCACVSRNGAGMVLKSTCVFPLSLASAGMGSVEKNLSNDDNDSYLDLNACSLVIGLTVISIMYIPVA